MARTLAYILCSMTLLGTVALVLITLLLALSPPYAGITGTWEFGPLFSLTHFRYYLARNAILNTLLLLAGVLSVGALLAWAGQRLGIDPRARLLLLVPLLLPGPVIALLWRPLFAPWLALGDTPLNLFITGLVLLWRITPLLLWPMTPRAWRLALGLSATLILLDGGLPLLLSGGAPYNAAHTWASWMLQQLWTNRAWGHAAHLSSALALLIGGIAWFTLPRDAITLPATPHPRTTWLGTLLGGLWIAAPFLLPLWTLINQPGDIQIGVVARGLLNSASITLMTGLLAPGLTWTWAYLPRMITPRAWISAALMLPPLWGVSVAYLTHAIPPSAWMARPLTLALLLALPAAALSLGWAAWDGPPTRHAWVWCVGACTLLVQAQSFALYLLLNLPPDAWTPTLRLVWTLAATPSANQAVLLLLHGLLAVGSAWVVQRGLRLRTPA